MVARIQKSWIIHSLENSLANSHQTNHALAIRARNCNLGNLSQGNERLYLHVHSSFIHNSKKGGNNLNVIQMASG